MKIKDGKFLMTNPTILTCAVTGSLTTLAQHPGLPCTPTALFAPNKHI